VNPPFCVGNIGHDAFAHFAGRGGLPFRGEIIPDVGLLVLDARGFGRLQAPDAGAGVFDHDLHGAAGEITGLRGAIAAEDEQLGDAFGKFFAQGGELLVRGGPDGYDVAVAVRILLLEGDALLEPAVKFGELVGGEPAHAVRKPGQDISRGVFAEDLGGFVDFVVGEDHGAWSRELGAGSQRGLALLVGVGADGFDEFHGGLVVLVMQPGSAVFGDLCQGAAELVALGGDGGQRFLGPTVLGALAPEVGFVGVALSFNFGACLLKHKRPLPVTRIDGRDCFWCVGYHSQLWMSRWRWMPAGHSGVVKLVSAKRT
jgi:hypothetical protein